MTLTNELNATQFLCDEFNRLALIHHPWLIADAMFEMTQRSEQNTELVNFRKKRAESQQVENKYLNVL